MNPIKQYLTATVRAVTSYPILIATSLLATAILLDPLVIGTNTGQDACVYTDAAETANWRIMDTPCRLTKESWIMGGILFWLTFATLGIFRMALRKILRIKN